MPKKAPPSNLRDKFGLRKNIYANYTNFDNLKSWHKFNLSLMTIIKKQLGNSHLSEFRVTSNKKKRYYWQAFVNYLCVLWNHHSNVSSK